MNRTLSWTEQSETFTQPWVSESAFSPPKRIEVADDRLKADEFYTQASQGSAFIYKGDFQNAKQLLQAVQRRIDKAKKTADSFHKHRQSQAHKAQMLARLLIRVEEDLSINLSRAPQVEDAIKEALDISKGPFVVSLRELLGYIGAHEWRKKGVFIESLDDVIHPHYGLFSPVRGEYLDLVQKAPLPSPLNLAMDIGTGTGVISILLAKRGVKRIIATDIDPRAVACAKSNISRFDFGKSIEVVETDMFAEGPADLIVCNPPWMPARPTSSVERAVYDENNQMLKAFLKGAPQALSENGEAWLILSDLAERLNLREKSEVENWIHESGLKVIDVLEARPKHSKAYDLTDPLHAARSQEITKLWRLKK